MKAFSKTLVLLLVSLFVASCGGGGGSGDSSGFNPPQSSSISVTSTSSSITTNSFIDLAVTVLRNDGGPILDGREVSATISPSNAGSIVGAPSAVIAGASATNTTVGGRTSFRFFSNNYVGAVNITVSTIDPPPRSELPTRTVSTSTTLTITSGGTIHPLLQLTATTTTLPINLFNVSPFLGSPYMAEVTSTWRRANGSLVDGGTVSVSVNPVGVTGGFTTLDDPETEDDPATPEIENNEFLIRLGQGPVDNLAGRATIFFHSLQFAGTSTMTVTATDPDNGQTISSTLLFTMTAAAPPLPATVTMDSLLTPVYVQGAGGNTSLTITATVRDGGEGFVPDPVSGNTAFNNVRYEVLTQGTNSGERMVGVNAAGQAVSGTTIVTRTSQGVASASFQSGTQVGTVSVRATADRADNNVDNGITDPVSATRTVVVSDGRLFDLDITTPSVSSVEVLPLSTGATAFSANDYFVTVGVVATDRQGNPVLPGTQIRFGLIDHPVAGFPATGSGAFVISGNDGDPQEGNRLFTAPTGAFTTAGGGAGPGDAVLVLGEDSVGNRDLESARTVQTVNSPTSLTALTRFNFNDDTGVSVNNGPVLPYLIGRAVDGNIVSVGQTDFFGVAGAFMTYSGSKIGKRVAVWAQGDGPLVSGSVEVVSDVEQLRYVGAGPGRMTAEPTTIQGNRTVPVLVCVYDNLDNPVQGVTIGFAFEGLTGGGSASTVDGRSAPGTLANPTGSDGCVIAQVATTGIIQGGNPLVRFFAGGLSAEVDIVTAGITLLTASPSSFLGDGAHTVTLRLVDGNGQPIPGVQLSGSCNSPGLSIGVPPGITDANGITTSVIFATGLDVTGGAPGIGTCEFTTPTGSPVAVVTVTGVDACLNAFSPVPAGCPSSLLTITIVGQGNVTSTPQGVIDCVTGNGGTCQASISTGQSISLTATPALGGTFVGWSGACFGTSPSIIVVMNVAKTCTATFAP